MNNQAIKNDLANGSDEIKNELEKQLRSIWQGHEESNFNRRFWRPVY